MGTRGATGVRICGVDKISYNHFDSYPDGLGDKMVADIRRLLRDPGLDGMRKLATEMRLVNGEAEKPTPADVAKLKRFTDLGVSRQSEDDWYCLTRRAHGRLADTLKSGIMIDAASFMADSLFCEYAYVVNLDDVAFEVYRGFQKEPHTKGRYAAMPIRDEVGRKARCSTVYYPVALVGSFDLADIPKNWAAQALPPEADE